MKQKPDFNRFKRITKHVAKAAKDARLIPHSRVYESAAIEITPQLGDTNGFTEESVLAFVRQLEDQFPHWFRPNPAKELKVDASVLVNGIRVSPPNPFKSGDLEEVAFLRKTRPDLARQLEIESIAESGYKGLLEADPFALLTEREKRELIQYGYDEGQSNPFAKDSWDIEGQAMARRYPLLARMLQDEAKLIQDQNNKNGPHGNPWRKASLNLTRAGYIAGKDPELAKLLEAEATQEMELLEAQKTKAWNEAEKARNAAEEAARKMQDFQ
ncbi:hypothetical protein G0Q06_00755 [Puniceicoccales bacterium CK1056]|uniref:Uncharacterized protein n=1 Tax=Oceanipulchritudo coccoides TaxID=2706888 RepID=A0A6B2LXI4_9BACT|nr:hypothetical protein [Oceanipulchritudo coccoides]NDV60973.1 hypothetical protein [Oceanipulchritudo coccoides]